LADLPGNCPAQTTGLTTAALIGILVGAGVVLVCIAAAVGLLIRKKRRGSIF